MIKYLSRNNFKKSISENIERIYHFSVAEYYDPNNINFGKLRVFNDEIIKKGGGFDFHTHRNIEIITYILKGKLTYKDSLNNYLDLTAGMVQHVSAGKGIVQREMNLEEEDLKLIQIWILPDKRNLEPTHSIYDASKINLNSFFKVAANTDAPLIINQDVNIYLLKLEPNKKTSFKMNEDRQGYLVQIEGEAIINTIHMQEKDALEIYEEDLNIKAISFSNIILIEMKKER